MKTDSKVRSRRNYNPENQGEINTMESMTIPDQVYTVSEILERFSQGKGVQVLTPSFRDVDDSDDFDIIELDKLDRMEREELRLQIKESIIQQKNLINEKYKSREEVSTESVEGDTKTKLDSNSTGSTDAGNQAPVDQS